MATLTTADKRYIRLMSGDTASTPEIDDVDLQMLHDIPAEDGCGCANANDTTVVWVLRARVAKAQILVDGTNEAGITYQSSQKRTALEKDLERWEKKCGMTPLGVIRVSSFSLGLDATPGDEWQGYPSWWLRWIGIQ